MSEHTPETLRKLFKHSVSDGLTLAELEIALELHADAWEADRKRIKELLEHRHVFGCGGVWGCAVCDRLIADLRGEEKNQCPTN